MIIRVNRLGNRATPLSMKRTLFFYYTRWKECLSCRLFNCSKPIMSFSPYPSALPNSLVVILMPGTPIDVEDAGADRR